MKSASLTVLLATIVALSSYGLISGLYPVLSEIPDGVAPKALSGLLPTAFLDESSVNIDGNRWMSSKEVLKTCRFDLPYWPWEFETAVGKRLRAHPWIEDARVQLSYFPLRVQLDLVEEEPWLVSELDQDTWIVGRSGVLIESVAGIKNQRLMAYISELPRLRGVTQGNAPWQANLEEAISSLQIYELAGGFPFRLEIVSVAPGQGLFLNASSQEIPQVIVPMVTFPESVQVLTRLGLVLRDLKGRSEVAEQIDLRFESQTVVELMNPGKQALERDK